MQKSYQKPHFLHFLRKWSESVRTTLLSIFLDHKQAFFLSTFLFIAEKAQSLFIRRTRENSVPQG